MGALPDELGFLVSERISRSAMELYRAVTEPALSCSYFMADASGPLEAGRSVEWSWPIGGRITVKVDRTEAGKAVEFRWQAHKVDYDTRVRISFEPEGADGAITNVRVEEKGWRPDEAGIASSYEHATGWQHMLQGLKMWAMHGIDHRSMTAMKPVMPGTEKPKWEYRTLETTRLVLRRHADADVPAIHAMNSRFEVARFTLRMPHPYTLEAAKEWVALIRKSIAEGVSVVWAITLRETGELVGGIGLRLDPAHEHAELGYSLGVEHWGKGYASEAVAPVLEFAFRDLKLGKVIAEFYTVNPASGRVLEKCGFERLCVRKRHVTRWGEWFDLVVTELMREDWEKRRGE